MLHSLQRERERNTLSTMLFSYNPKSPGEHLAEPPPQCEACSGIPQASRGVGLVLILLFTVVHAETKASVCCSRCHKMGLEKFLQCHLKQERGSYRRQPPEGLSRCLSARRRGEGRRREPNNTTILLS